MVFVSGALRQLAVSILFNANCAVGIEPNHERIKQNLENSLMLVTVLDTRIGYEKVAAIAKKAHKDGTILRHSASIYPKTRSGNSCYVYGNQESLINGLADFVSLLFKTKKAFL